MPYSVYLKKNEEKRLQRGHSWVYANEVARIEGKDKNGALAAAYDALKAGRPDVIFGGRLGEYKYYDMDKVILSAFRLCEKENLR